MLKREKLDEFFQEFTKLLPEDFRIYKRDMEKNLKAALNGAFARLDLVTREEFDIQNELLAKTRALVAELGKKIEELERASKDPP